MRLSFDDEESFKESVGSLNFNRSSSDSDSLQEVLVGSSMPSRRGMRMFILINSPSHWQVIRISYLKFGECQWEVVVLVVHRPRRGVKTLKDSDILANYGQIATTTMPVIDLFESTAGIIVRTFKLLETEVSR